MRRISVVARCGLAVLFSLGLLAIAAYCYREYKWDVLMKDKHTTIQVNGNTVKGEVLRGRFIDLVTIREKGKERSYFVYWHVTDNFEPMPVIDCGKWIAPNFPFYVAINGYSNRCEDLPDKEWWRSTLKFHVFSKQFTTSSGDVISLRRE